MKKLVFFMYAIFVFNSQGKLIHEFPDGCSTKENKDGSFYVILKDDKLGYFPLGYCWYKDMSTFKSKQIESDALRLLQQRK